MCRKTSGCFYNVTHYYLWTQSDSNTPQEEEECVKDNKVKDKKEQEKKGHTI